MMQQVYVCTYIDTSQGRDIEYQTQPIAIFFSEEKAKKWVEDNIGNWWLGQPTYTAYDVE